jgi:hypothetical protein
MQLSSKSTKIISNRTSTKARDKKKTILANKSIGTWSMSSKVLFM